jgi:uncharacterized protein (DUF169 family)
MDLKEVNEALNYYLRLQTFPVAVRMCRSDEELPDKVRIPKQDMGTAVTVCQSIGLARRFGWTIAIGRDDQSCPHGLFVLGFVSGKSYLDGSSGEAAGIGAREELAREARGLSRLEYGKYKYLLAAPLHNASFEPHLIIVYGNPAQAARLAQGAVALGGEAITTPSTGGIACSSLIARTMLTDECQIVLAGAGDRYFALTQDHELAFTIPWSKAESTIQGLEKGHKSGLHRYPTPSSFKLEGVLPPVYRRWAELLREEGDGG